MARTITFGSNAPEPVEVVLFEHKYVLRPHTRSVELELRKVEKQRQALSDKPDESDPGGDKMIAVMAAGIGAMLASSNGTDAPDVKKVLLEAWKQDQVSVEQIGQLAEALQEAQEEQRPT